MAELLPFHPAVQRWFLGHFERPTEAQTRAWPALFASDHVLLAAPTGAGKTLAAFLVALDRLVGEGTAAPLPDETRVLYVSPLRALSSDVEKNLLGPLAGIRAELLALGLPDVDIRTHVRTGDTDAKARAKATKRPPHIYVTTPESLYVLLTSEGGRRMLSTVQTVIVDEIHALIQDRRGSHLALSLERLDALTGREVQRVGLSATQKPVSLVASFLLGQGKGRGVTTIDLGHKRERDLDIVVPNSPLEAVMSGEVWEEVYGKISDLIAGHRTTLVFVNSRRLAERLARHLALRVGADQVAAHHGSLAREHRFVAEQKLKQGELKVIVATASLELGIDVGDVDLVVQVGGARSISSFLQRVGRSGHSLSRTPKGRIFPLSRDELVEAVALVLAIGRGELEVLHVPEAPLDILAQQIVAAVAAEGEWSEVALFELFRRAYPYRNLSRARFNEVLDMLANGFSTDRGRRAAHIFRELPAELLRPRRGARLTAITSGGAIPDVADYDVVLEPEGLRVGSVHEDFAIESMAGDVFQLGNTSYAIRRVEPGTVRVVDAHGAPPTLPFWLGEAPARSDELSRAVSRLRREVAEAIVEQGPEAAVHSLQELVGVDRAACEQVVTYFALTLSALGVLPTDETFVLERFFDEVGSTHLVLHAPLGGRMLRGYGLALRKCFCRKFDFELQAAANDDAIILSLGPTHSFPLEDVFHYLKSASVGEILIQALLVAPLFTTRFRWNAQRALAVPRFRGGRKVPPRFARMDADDLMTTCFPDQVACAENLSGDREVPDHPLVQQTVLDATTEAVDLEGLVTLLGRMEQGKIRLCARDVTEPSPLAAGILTAKPYAFLDDAPLEERRTQAVLNRRWLDLGDARVTGILDPEAIQRIVREAWPEPRNADELLDALETYGFLRQDEGQARQLAEQFEALVSRGRALSVQLGVELWIARARAHEFEALGCVIPAEIGPIKADCDRETALREIVRSRLSLLGPTTRSELARDLGVGEGEIAVALLALEAEGGVMRGAFRPGSAADSEWCDRRLLARIHRASLDRLRAEIQPVSQQDYVRFLFAWHGVDRVDRPSGAQELARVLERLEGFEAPASAWESQILPLRLAQYDPGWLDELCLSGQFTWLRLRRTDAGKGALRATSIALVARERAEEWRAQISQIPGVPLSSDAERLASLLRRRGACFYRDLLQGSRLLPSQVDEGLRELVRRGKVSSDSFAGLRALVTSSRLASAHRRPRYSLETSGRWTFLDGAPAEDGQERLEPEGDSRGRVEVVARALLARYGVVFRHVLELESELPPWRELLSCLRRLEARGEVRGGRFVAGYAGEQYALPEAVRELRQVRGRAPNGRYLVIGAADPLNVAGVLVPGERVMSSSKSQLVFKDGVCVGVGSAMAFDMRVVDVPSDLPPRQTLFRGTLHPHVRSYLGAR